MSNVPCEFSQLVRYKDLVFNLCFAFPGSFLGQCGDIKYANLDGYALD